MTHHLPANLVAGDESDFVNSVSYRTRPVILKEFNGVRVSPDSVAYKNGLLINDTVNGGAATQYYQFRHLIKKYLKGKTIQLDRTKKHLLITDIDSSGHFHWFCEVLPKLIDIKDDCKDFVLLLPDKPYINKIGLESLRLMGFEFGDIIFMKRTGFYKVRDLFYIPSVSKNGLNDDLVKAVHEQIIGNRKAGKKKIYISRQKAAYRKIANEEELVSLLQQYGFEILNAEDHTLEEQLDIFSSCDTLMGIHGAGLTNCFFMRTGGKLVELRKKENNTTNVGYWHLADSLGHAYYYHNGIPDSDLSLVGRGCNLTIPLADFEKKILASLETIAK